MFAFFPLVAKVWKLCSEKEPGRQTNYSQAPQSCHHHNHYQMPFKTFFCNRKDRNRPQAHYRNQNYSKFQILIVALNTSVVLNRELVNQSRFWEQTFQFHFLVGASVELTGELVDQPQALRPPNHYHSLSSLTTN